MSSLWTNYSYKIYPLIFSHVYYNNTKMKLVGSGNKNEVDDTYP